MNANKFLTMALKYAEVGWQVFPVHYPTAGRCSCNKRDCGSVGKHPMTKNGFRDATTDQAIIRGWWATHPGANVGIRTGAVSNLVVIDVDPRHGGDDTLLDLEQEYGKLPWTAEAMTGGGGRHILFKHPGVRIRSKAASLGLGLDVRGDDALIVAPPSMHISGQVYQWEPSCLPSETPLAEMPKWLIDLTKDDQPVQEYKRAEPIADEIPSGQRNEALSSLAGSMRRRGMMPESIYAALMEENNARCNPPLSADEVSAIAHSVGRYTPTAPFMPHGEDAEAAKPREPKNAYAVSVEFLDLLSNIAGRTIRTGISNIDAKFGGIERQSLTVLAARPSMGKSTLGWQIARNVAAQGFKVLFFSLEMSAPSLWAKAACGGIGVRWLKFRTEQNTEEELTQVIDKSVELMNLYGESLMIDDGVNTSKTIWETVEKNKPDLVVIDHLRLIADRDGDKREDQRLGIISQRMKDMAKGFNCGCLLLAQLNRGVEGREDKRPQLSDLRDSGHVEENADVVWMLYRDDYYNNSEGNADRARYSETELLARKFRDDVKDTRVKLAFDVVYQWFDDLDAINISDLSSQRLQVRR